MARYGLTSFLAHAAHGLLDALPWPFRVWLWRAFLGSLGRSVILEHRVFIRPPQHVHIGDDCFVGRGCELWAHSAEADIRLGHHVLLGPGVLITTLGHDPQDPQRGVLAKPVRVGDRAWLGARCVILPGVTVGEGAVVAAGAVVAEDVPPWTLVGGVPAKAIRSLGQEGAKPSLAPPRPEAQP